MDYIQLKRQIYEDSKVVLILEKLGCYNIHNEQRGGLIVASLPDGDNKRSIQIKNKDTLSMNIRSRGISGSILDLIAYINGFYNGNRFNIQQASKWAMEVCGYEESGVYIEQPLDWLKKLKRKRKRELSNVEIPELPTFSENIFKQNRFIMQPQELFINDGISAKTQKEFDVGFDKKTQRVVFAIRDLEGKLVGVKGRTVIEDERKYKYIYPWLAYQSAILFNYHRAISEISLQGSVIVFEAEKSPMQMYDMGIYNSVAIGSSDASPYQIKILKDLKCDVVLAHDKGTDLGFLKEKYKKLGYFRNIYVIIDIEGLLQDKDSPSDRGLETWNRLYKSKIKLF